MDVIDSQEGIACQEYTFGQLKQIHDGSVIEEIISGKWHSLLILLHCPSILFSKAAVLLGEA
jgi:hypothetical protein